MAIRTVPGAAAEPASERSAAGYHRVSFAWNMVSGLWRGRCEGCGWYLVGTEDEVMRRAAGHD